MMIIMTPFRTRKERRSIFSGKTNSLKNSYQVGQDIETEVLEEKDDEMISSLTPTKRKVDERLSKAKGKRKRGKEKRLVKHTTKLVESRLTSDLKKELAKQASNINQITKMSQAIAKIHYNDRKTVQVNQANQGTNKALQKQTFDILKAVRKVK